MNRGMMGVNSLPKIVTRQRNLEKNKIVCDEAKRENSTVMVAATRIAGAAWIDSSYSPSVVHKQDTAKYTS